MRYFQLARRVMLLSGVALLSTAVHAQNAAPAEPDQTATLKTTRNAEGEIIVTARRYVPVGAETANKSNIPLIQTPQSVTVITRDQIDLLNFIDAQQAVRYTAGVTGENYGPDPRYDFITVRGFTPKQYIDGLAVPATSTISATGVDIYAFQSLDILKGPASVLYGSAPPGGILNEVSRRASSEFGGELKGTFGTNSYKEGAGTITGAVMENLAVRLTGLYRDSDTDVDHTKDKRYLIEPTATWKIGSSTKLTGLFYYQHDHNTGGAGGFLPYAGTLGPNPNGHISRSTNLDSPTTLFKRNQYGAGFELEHDFGNAISFTSNTKFSHYKEATPIGVYSGGGYVTVNAANANDPANFRMLQQYNFSYEEKVNSFATDNRFAAKLDTGALTHKILAGVDYRNVRNDANYNFVFAGVIDAFNPVYPAVDSVNIGFPTRYNKQILRQTGIYGQDQIAFGDLYLLLSGRYDWVKAKTAGAFVPVGSPNNYTGQKQHKFTYRAGLNYVLPSGIAPYVSYATSFEPLLGTDSVKLTPFKPTTAKQFEGGVKYDARGLGPDIKLFASAAAFDIRQTNFVLNQTGQTPISGVQGGLVEVYGAEFELVARFREQLSINASYSYNHSEIKKNPNALGDVGFPLPTTPKNKLSLLADYTFRGGILPGFGFGGGVRYNSNSAGATPTTASGIYVVTGNATLFDATVHYDTPGWRFQVNASNLTDKDYVARCTGNFGCVYGAGRQILGSVTKKF